MSGLPFCFSFILNGIKMVSLERSDISTYHGFLERIYLARLCKAVQGKSWETESEKEDSRSGKTAEEK
ncbi:hypothetical protein LIER_20715 [Lithospermum erythrorhizon]|uniref:Uncharacterized protein n=1 Tax=Lithospermum erythrorhizon TaxID=34254 RepID=A0AAV3QMJ0_LITER